MTDFQRGYCAAKLGKSIQSCPHPEDSEKYNDWCSGFTQYCLECESSVYKYIQDNVEDIFTEDDL